MNKFQTYKFKIAFFQLSWQFCWPPSFSLPTTDKRNINMTSQPVTVTDVQFRKAYKVLLSTNISLALLFWTATKTCATYNNMCFKPILMTKLAEKETFTNLLHKI